MVAALHLRALLPLLALDHASHGGEECDGKDCKFKKNTTLSNSLNCTWRVVDQVIIAHEPLLLQAPVEESCPLKRHGLIHLLQCEACAKLHRPCNGEYAACQGCCGTPWHTGFAVPTQHSCDDVKLYYKTKNNPKVKCDSSSSEPIGRVKVEKAPPGRFNDTIEDECHTPVWQVHCKRIPVKFEFRCDQCNIGSPFLLKKCCDAGVEWANSDAVDELRAEGYEPFVWLSGCDAEGVRAPDGYEEFEWIYAQNYSNYSKDTVDSNYDAWIDENVCALLNPPEMCRDPTVPTTTTTTTQLVPKVLFRVQAGYDYYSWYQNYWSYWRTAGDQCGTNWYKSAIEEDRCQPSTNGKRWEYDNLKLSDVLFECTSNSDGWAAQYKLYPEYQGKTMREIVSGCIPSRGCANWEKWNDEMCTIGEVVPDTADCGDIPLGCSDTLRLGVGDGTPYDCDRNWVLFAVGSGRRSSSYTFNGYAFASLGSYSRSAWCPSGRLTMSGIEYQEPPVATTTETTTCYNYCKKKDDPRRLQGEWQQHNQSENNLFLQRRLEDQAPPTDEMTSCPWFVPGDRLPVRNFTASPSGAPDVDHDAGVPPDSADDVDDPMTNVISFQISGLDVVTTEDFTAVRKACAEGLASALSLPSPGWCAVNIRVHPESCDFLVGISVPLSIARNSHLTFKLEPAIKMALFEANMAGLIAGMEFKMDGNVTNIEHEMLTETCRAVTLLDTSAGDASLSQIPTQTWGTNHSEADKPDKDNSTDNSEHLESSDSGIQVLPHALVPLVFLQLLV